MLLPAGERSVRFYPRYDTEASSIDEALSILRLAIEDLVGGRLAPDAPPVPKVRVGTLAIPLETIDRGNLVLELPWIRRWSCLIMRGRTAIQKLSHLGAQRIERDKRLK